MTSELFGHVQEFPDPDSGVRFEALVGLDDVKVRLINEATVILQPELLDKWATVRHMGTVHALQAVRDRVPLIVLAGDVGTGKTELAETVGHPIAHQLGVDVTLYPLSLNARGAGLVGQMTTLITSALNEIRNMAAKSRTSDGQLNRAVILLVDEADSVAQSRELAQMHHEDRAGVNALIQGIDSFRKEQLPVLTIMCTNRPDAIDPAVARRAAHVFRLGRPTAEQTREVLNAAFAGIAVSHNDLDEVAMLLHSDNSKQYGPTYSDLRQRFVPDAVLDAFGRDAPIVGSRLIELAASFTPTRPFGSGS
ncbi:ATP-binding protein [Streptomyces sp. SID13031]|uniref:AAA family ATPase n=1 Tax=Streptomyces sp. SID13031 TaxID=2706046 RepID=UPI0013C5B5E0|nr:ATP-binding protein [Streptomyces sp. SID13031]NEA30225.1 AAA family ATPase [Streptomyces sp. SID13031]